MEGLGFPLQTEAVLQTLTEDVIKSSEIEGEMLDCEQVRSSIARRLGMDIGALTPADRNVEGVVEMMLDATQQFDQPLTQERLFGWHAALFPTGRSGMRQDHGRRLARRQDRTDAGRLGPVGTRARPLRSARRQSACRDEMRAFLDWFSQAARDGPGAARPGSRISGS